MNNTNFKKDSAPINAFKILIENILNFEIVINKKSEITFGQDFQI